MLEIEWLEMARADLLGIVDYISDDDPDAAQKLKKMILKIKLESWWSSLK